ncbi:class I SAM-dependent methyltransferase [Candidatus Methylacidiphilum infernorum]|uniref:SAM-dependent methyltransferase n=1 Tax=Methylacidiphilum infernorum (isolate V4) TaxID=481448 RepID=B3DZK5_METI4|nr:class I SAM-dependent methyltransferase [Candidatus Methylacidiphilum infernorum]ACD82622.1 SAM-dependent methyltransferase [Methylacidiphilum infernorum V4]
MPVKNQSLYDISLEAVPFCPVCGGEGKMTFKEVGDPLGSIPGRWSYKSCQSCFSMWMDPKPIKEDIPKLYPRDYYTHEKVDESYWIERSKSFISKAWQKIWVSELSGMGYSKELASHGLKSTRLGQLLALFPPIKMAARAECRFLPASMRGKVLDVGCGNGCFLYFMKKLGWEVQGVEPDPRAAQICKDLGIEVFQAPIEECPLEKDHYEAITLSHVIEHLSDPKEVLLKLFSSLKPGGMLVSVSPNPVGQWARAFGPAWRGLDPPRHLVLISPQGFELIGRQLAVQSFEWLTTWRNEHSDVAQSKAIRMQGHCRNFQVSLPQTNSTVILLPRGELFSFPDLGKKWSLFLQRVKKEPSPL